MLNNPAPQVLQQHANPLALHSFRTRHSSDLDLIFSPAGGPISDEFIERAPVTEVMALRIKVSTLEDVMIAKLLRSEEHTSELESRRELGCRLPLEKDKIRASAISYCSRHQGA